MQRTSEDNTSQNSNHAGVNNNSDSSSRSNNGNEDGTFKIAVYKRRWLMLFIVAFLNVSNGALWINFASIANSAATFYGVPTSAIDWLSLVFFISTIPFMFVAMWITDRFGFKVGVLVGCALNFLGALVRLFGTFDFVDPKYPITITGQTIASLAQPFAMSLPTKVSEIWFPEDQRTFSTAISSMGNPLGLMLGTLLAPIIVSVPSQVPLMNEVFCAIGLFAGLMGFLVKEAAPPLPPSITADRSAIEKSYLRDLKLIIMNKDFFVLMLAIGGGMGLLSALQSMLMQMLCPFGYTDNFSGLCDGLMVVGGFIGAALNSYIAEKTKMFEEIVKLCYGIAILMAIILVLIMTVHDIAYAIAIICTLFGYLAVGVYPVSLEIAVEITYPIDESISAGIIVVAGQILGTIFMLVMEALGRPLSAYDQQYQKCTSDDDSDVLDFRYSGLFLIGVASLLSILLTIFFKPKFKRREAEQIKPLKRHSTIATISGSSCNNDIATVSNNGVPPTPTLAVPD